MRTLISGERGEGKTHRLIEYVHGEAKTPDTHVAVFVPNRQQLEHLRDRLVSWLKGHGLSVDGETSRTMRLAQDSTITLFLASHIGQAWVGNWDVLAVDNKNYMGLQVDILIEEACTHGADVYYTLDTG